MDLAVSRFGRSCRRLARFRRIARNVASLRLANVWSGIGVVASALWLRRIVLRRAYKPKHFEREPHAQDHPNLEVIDRAALDVLPEHICIIDESGTILAVNRAWREFAKQNPPLRSNVCEGANYLAVCDAAKSEPGAKLVALALRALLSARQSDFELEYPCHSPFEERWFVVRGYPYFHRDAVRVVIAHEKVTERKLAERAAFESEAQYRESVEQALDGFYVLDRAGRFTMVNEATCEMTGYPRSELIGMHALQVLAPEDHPQFIEIWPRLLDGEIDQSEWCLLRKDGSHLNIEVRAHLDASDHVVGFARDITDRKETEELRKARDAAETASRAKDEFLAMLSHELRTPLAPVLLATRMIEQDEQLPEQVRELARTIHRNIELQARLIDDLLDQTRIARGKMELQCKKVAVNELIEHVLNILDSEFKSKNLQIGVDLQTANPYVEGDVARLQQILWNLLKNAVKFTPPFGSIKVRTSNPNPRRVQIEVTDTGIGIEPEELSRLFRAFEQGDVGTARRFDGLGLGLAISEKLAILHGGSLTARSAGKNRGATFTLELPTIPIPSGETQELAPPTQPPAAVPHLRILLVEDHADTAKILARLLERHGHHVVISTTLHDAEALADSEPLDLVLSDIDLPDGTGYELMQYLRSSHPLPGIAMSGFGMEQDVRRSHEAGFSEHLVKPVDPCRLEQAIGKVATSAE